MNTQWLFNAVALKDKDKYFFKEFAWIYVDLQYGHDEEGNIIRYGQVPEQEKC